MPIQLAKSALYLAALCISLPVVQQIAAAQSAPIFVTEANIDSTRTFRLTADVRASGTGIYVMVPDVTVDLNGKTLTFGTENRHGSIGVHPFIRRPAPEGDQTYLASDDFNYPQTATSGNGKRTKVKNGRIVFGGTTASWAAGIGGPWDSGDITVDDVEIDVNGPDGMCVHFRYSGAQITNTHCINRSLSTENRHQLPGSFKIGGKLVAFNNIVEGGNSSIVCGSNSVVYNNVLRHNSFATNGYGVHTYRNVGVSIYGNLVVPSNGRGLMFNAGENHNAYDNLITAHELPNNEYGELLNATCVRMRYDTKNIAVTNNRCLAIGGGALTAASGIYLTNYGGTPNVISKNEFRAILGQDPDREHYANAVTMESQGTPAAFSRDRIEDNKFSSNNYLVRLSGYDGGAYQDVFERNQLAWQAGRDSYQWFVSAISESRYNYSYPATNRYVTAALLTTVKNAVKAEVEAFVATQPDDRMRKTFFTGYADDSYITMLDTTLGAGVGLESSDIKMELANRGATDIKVARSLYIQAMNGAAVLANQTVRVSDNTGTTFTVTTDTAGKARLVLISYALVKPASQTTNPVAPRQDRSGHMATVGTLPARALPASASGNSAQSPLVINFGAGGQPTTPSTPTTPTTPTTPSTPTTPTTPVTPTGLSCGGRPATIVSSAATVRGTEGADVIVGTSRSRQVFYGLGGDDRICTGNGGSIVYGGNGSDYLQGGYGVDQLNGETGNDTLRGDAGNDTLRGGNGTDVLDGGPGDDMVTGDWGDDVLSGGTGNDQLYGGGDDDRLDGGSGTDRCDGGIQRNRDTSANCETRYNLE